MCECCLLAHWVFVLQKDLRHIRAIHHDDYILPPPPPPPGLTVRAVNGSRLSADRTFLSASAVPHQKLRKFHEAEWSEWTIFHLWSTVKDQWPSLHSKVKTLHKAGSPLSFQWAWSTPDYFIGRNWTQVLTVVKGEWQTLTHTSYNAFQKCKAEWWHSSTKKQKQKHGKLLMTQFATLLHSWVSRTKLAALKHSKRLIDTGCNTSEILLFFCWPQYLNDKNCNTHTQQSCWHNFATPLAYKHLWGHDVGKPSQKKKKNPGELLMTHILQHADKMPGSQHSWRSFSAGRLSTHRGWSCIAHAHNTDPSMHHTSACTQHRHGAHGEWEGWGSRWGRSRAGCGWNLPINPTMFS